MNPPHNPGSLSYRQAAGIGCRSRAILTGSGNCSLVSPRFVKVASSVSNTSPAYPGAAGRHLPSRPRLMATGFAKSPPRLRDRRRPRPIEPMVAAAPRARSVPYVRSCPVLGSLRPPGRPSCFRLQPFRRSQESRFPTLEPTEGHSCSSSSRSRSRYGMLRSPSQAAAL